MIKQFLKNILTCVSILFITTSYGDSILNHPLKNLDDSNFQQVQEILSKPASIEGNFTQVRNVKILSQPLVSSGAFLLSKKDGLLWKQDKPFISTMTMNSQKIEQKIMDNPPSVLTEKEQPAVFNFTKIFLSVFQGNLSEVQQYFNIYFMGDAHHWEMLLIPTGSPLNKAIYSIQLNGERTIQEVTVIDAEKNSLKISFSRVILHDE